MRSAFVRLAFGALLLLAAAPAAHAKEEFPGEIARDLGLAYDPPCRLCHIQGTTGAGSISTPFGISGLAHGLQGSRSSIAPMLGAMAADRTDSDGDGKPDIDELMANTDPNTPADVMLANSSPQYGCSASNARLTARVGETLLGALLIVSALLGRSRRARR